MSKIPNGTDAKDIALHFVAITTGRATPAIMGKTIAQAKTLLKSGYTKEEVISVMDEIVSRGVQMYSIGYVSSSIEDILRELKQKKQKEDARDIQKELQSKQEELRQEVAFDGESAKRNQEKARNLGLQSRIREKFNFDLFEK